MKVKTLADMDEIETQVHAALVGYEFGRFLNKFHDYKCLNCGAHNAIGACCLNPDIVPCKKKPKSEEYRMKADEPVIPPPFGRIPVLITKSNMSFVEVGERTHITTMHGKQYIWSSFCKSYELLSWAIDVWKIEYEVIAEE